MRLVDADAAIDALKEYFNDEDQKDTEYGAYWHHSHVLKVLESLPPPPPTESDMTIYISGFNDGYRQGWDDGQEELRKEMWERERE